MNVVALIGERGREVREFIERDLGPGGPGPLGGDRWPPRTSRRSSVSKGALAATAIAEYFRDQGSRVLLMMELVTRFVWRSGDWPGDW